MDDSASNRFGDLLRRHRLAAGLTQEELAERAGLGRRSIQGLERGESVPHRGTLQRLMQALALSPEESGQFVGAAKPLPRRGLPEIAASGESSSGARLNKPRHHNLPTQLTSFLGREREVSEVTRLLAETHLLTLTGAGGCGKTRLALEAARGLVDDFADGVWLVELAPLADPELIPAVVIAALDVREVPGEPILTTLLAALPSRQILLVLDNCEHLIGACARLVDALLRQCPDVHVVATSREPLRVAGEAVFRVPSLAVPSAATNVEPEELARFAAVRLFLDRARAAGSGFAFTVANAPAVAQVCRRLDGIPLALELAAARTQTLTVEQIAARLNRRFGLLTGGNRAALPRQQTLAATVSWSYDLLTEPERRLFNRLSVFAGGFDLEAAERVCADAPLAGEDVLDLLTGLVQKSMVVAEAGEGDVKRYFLFETLRAWGWDQLLAAGEANGLRNRHRDWYAALAERVAPNLFGFNVARAVARLTAEHDNLRMALTWCLERDADVGLNLAVTLGHFWESRGHEVEGRRWIESLLARASSNAAVRARALFCIAVWLRDWGDFATAMSRAEESLVLAHEAGSAADIGAALTLLGSLAMARGEYDRAELLMAEGLGLARKAGNAGQLSFALTHLGELYLYAGDDARARACFDEHLAIVRADGSDWGIGDATSGLGTVARSTGDVQRAEELLRESVDRFRKIGDKPGTGWSLGYLGYLTGLQGNDGDARAMLRESAGLFREVGHVPRLVRSVCFLGILALRRGHIARGVRLVAATEAANHFLRATLAPDERGELEAALLDARAAMGDAGFAAAWAEGHAMTREQAVAYALEEDGRG